VGGEVRGNYCTLNALVNASVNTYANGNLECYFPAATANATAFGTIAVSSGKWYWECQRNDISSGLLVGIARVDANPASLIGSQVLSYAYKDSNGNKINNGTSSAYGATFNTANIIGVALDLDAGTLTFYKDNVSQGTAFSGISGSFFPAWSEDSAGGGSGVNVNFGSRSFIYTAPSGFKALCTANLPAPVVTKPSDLFDVKLYTGNGSTQTISGLGFSPDLVWTKARNTNYSHQLIDIIRGGTTVLFSDRTQAEGTYSSITSFNSDGYTVSTELGVNGSGDSFAAWCWDAGSSTVTNTQGSISSQVRANASAGFSIVTYTGNSTVGATVGHGLGVAPQLIIIKARNNVSGGFWQVYHQAIGNTKYLELNSTSAAGTSSNRWNNTTPSSTVFTLGSDSDLNGSLNYVAYCFAPVAGYANAFSYTGTGGEGPMVYLGMRPRLVLIKRTDSTGSWFLFDAARSPYNETRKYLLAESSAAEGDDGDITNGWQLDFLSNGFKIRADAALQLNANGGTYVGFAWAESPFQYARAR
jgi:hypothetical protein